MIIKRATLEDLKYIESLAKKESQSIGFIPKVRYEAAIIGKRIREAAQPNCNDKLYMCFEDNEPVGFVLGSSGKKSKGAIAKVSQICIQEDARLLERGKGLLNAFTWDCENRGIFDFQCACADDLDSNLFWKAMGWELIGQRKGRHYSNTWKDSSGRIVNLYMFRKNNLIRVGVREAEGDSL